MGVGGDGGGRDGVAPEARVSERSLGWVSGFVAVIALPACPLCVCPACALSTRVRSGWKVAEGVLTLPGVVIIWGVAVRALGGTQ